MANREHLQILQQGVEAWNAWRDQLTRIALDHGSAPITVDDLLRATFPGIDLTEVNLSRVSLTGADLSRVSLTGADLRQANLTEADLSRASLTGANLRLANLRLANLHLAKLFGAADLRLANLTEANLPRANLSRADLSGANLSRADLSGADLSGANLTAVRGLETCFHHGPSILDHRTLARSGPLPLAFLRGCGLPDTLIDYLPSLLGEPVQFYSCFISYASKDQVFAERLHADLQNKGVRCWFAPEDMKIGDRLRLRIDETIRVYDKLLLILSKTSVASQWVEQEVETALARERQQGMTVLFPVRIDNTVMTLETGGWPALIRNTRNIGDFRRWKTHDVYQKAFDRLLRDLKAAERQP